ncbi:motility associated factor glycosyltransferase family protein [Campylobacter armoricus]|uniref:motility associated factor glycosyltransferase family protein n=1 Tax=Campylobacter armoricus TaxID=2505970 RepID=UPI001F1C63DE|nr:motility associated factor glycosyltransferase family protein [Campylobacter armoricus]
MSILENNINALFDYNLKEQLKKVNQAYQIVQGDDNLDINIIDGGGDRLYDKPLEELNKTLNLYNDKYLLYPILFFYGFGNGILYKALLQNKNHKLILVFESDIRLIYTIFSILDFSKELKEGRLLLINPKKITKYDLKVLCSNNYIFNFLRTYFLEIHCNYYDGRYQEEILKLNSLIQEVIKESIFSHGNSPVDYLQGIEHFICNIPKMVCNLSYKELLNKRKNLSDTAIIVSTGPSLTKQLPLLKQYQSKASIFCADSAYPILAKANIKPDYVFSLERTDFTSEFFNHDFGEFDKDILFIVKSVVHPNTIKYLENKQTIGSRICVVSNPSNFIVNVKLNHFGYFGMGVSVAHMAYTLAFNLGHKNIILIGQDLAYNDIGESHPKDYQHTSRYESDLYNYEDTLAYGGNSLVKTHCIWLWFKSILEDLISKNHISITYNCTEGGARINGTIEEPFARVCEKLLKKDLDKSFPKLSNLSINKQNELLLKAYYRINKDIQNCEKLSKDFNYELKSISNDINLIKHENNKKLLESIMHKINMIKIKVESLLMYSLCEVLNPLIRQFELNLARIYVLNPKTPEDSHNKSMLWIKEHLNWIQLIIAHIDSQKEVLQKSIVLTKDELIKRGFINLIEKIEQRILKGL